MNSHVLNVYNELNVMFERPYKVYFIGLLLIYESKMCESITYLYFYQHEQCYCLKQTKNVITSKLKVEILKIDPVKVSKPKGHSIKCFVAKTNLIVNIKKTDEKIYFSSNNKEIIVYCESSYFANDGLNNHLLKSENFDGLKNTIIKFMEGKHGSKVR